MSWTKEKVVTPEIIEKYKNKCEKSIYEFPYEPKICENALVLYNYLISKEKIEKSTNIILEDRKLELLNLAYQIAIFEIKHTHGGKHRSRRQPRKTHRKRRHTSLKRK